MKKLLVTLVCSICITVLLPCFPAQAKSIAPQTLQVYHPQTIGTTAMGEETYKYQTLVGNDNKAVSIVEVFQPPRYDGFLLRKHVIQNPEEMYVINGDFEVIFSETNEKIEVTTGDLVTIPASLPFGFRHRGRGEGEIRIISYSDRLGKMLGEIGTLRATTSNIDAISSIAQKYGIEYLD